LGALWLITGCASGGGLKESRSRIQWAAPEQAGEGPVVMNWADEREGKKGQEALWGGPTVAVLPVYNLTAAPAPLRELEQLLTEALARRGAVVLDEQVLDAFMTKRRMRYTGGLDRETALSMAEETGVETVLVSTLEYFEEGTDPKVSLHARLVSTGPDPEILWMDSVCRGGDDKPGFLDLGVISDSRKLLQNAAQDLAASLMGHLAGRDERASGKDMTKGILPTVSYRDPGMDFTGRLTVAVIPFFNLSERPYAWEILPLHFVEGMLDSPDFVVLEPGVVRRSLLRTRVMVGGGLSGPHLELILSTTDADLVVTGSVMRYLDSPYAAQGPEVEFSVQVYERKSRKIVWSSRSVGRGKDGVYFFNKGYRSTACRLCSEMSRTTINEMTRRAAGETTMKGTEGKAH